MPEPELLNVPPEEAVRRFEAKGYHVGFDWRDTAASEHARSFTVAKAMNLDVLSAIRGEVDRALVEGTTFETFADTLEPTLRKLGWWGRQRMTDPVTGETRVVQLGSVRRLKTIFDTNLRMSRAAGHWERIERLAARRPWLRYVAVADLKTRLAHLAWHGTVLRWDDPFWNTHYPPNGWFCRCTVMQLDDDDLDDFGYKPSDGPPPGSEETRVWIDRRNDGRRVDVPVGIDPGFAHNVGRVGLESDAGKRLIGKLDRAAPDLARAAVGTMAKSRLFSQFVSGGDRDSHWPVAVLPDRVRAALGGDSRTVRLSGETALAKTTRHGLKSADWALAQRALDEGELFLDEERRAVSAFVEHDGRSWRAVVKVTRDGRENYLPTLHIARVRDRKAARKRLSPIKR